MVSHPHRWRETVSVVVFLLFMMTVGTAQTSAPSTYTIDSWKTGGTLVQEQTLQFELNRLRKRPMSVIVKDRLGRSKYKLETSFQERTDRQTVSQGWNIELFELGKVRTSDLLKPIRRRYQDEYRPEDHISLLLYQSDALNRELPVLSVPFTARRIIKVESFYCVIQVLRLTLSRNNRSVRGGVVSISFVNQMPPDVASTRTTSRW